MAIFKNSINVSPIINNVRQQKSCTFCGNYFDNEKDLSDHTLSVHVMPLDLSPQMHPQVHPQVKSQVHTQVNLQRNSQVHPQVQPQVQPQVHPQEHPQLHPQRNYHVDTQLNPHRNSQMNSQVHPQMHPVQPQVYPQSNYQVHTQRNSQIYPQVHRQEHPQVHPQSNYQVHPQRNSQFHPKINSQVHPQMQPQVQPQVHPQVHLQEHRQMQSQVETFSCESCDVNFSEPESLKKHMALHEVFGIKVGQCEIQSVGATTASKPKENENLKNQHNIAPGPADSKIENNFTSGNIINNKNDKFVSCEICHMFSGTPSTLQMHQKIVHEGQKLTTTDFKKNEISTTTIPKESFAWETIQTCDICKRFSGSSSTLEIHMSIVHKENKKKLFQTWKESDQNHFDDKDYEFSTEQFIQMAILGSECVFCNTKIEKPENGPTSKKLQEHMNNFHRNQKPKSEIANNMNNSYTTTRKDLLYSIFTPKQVWYLEKIFSVKKNLNNSEMERLSQLGNFPTDKIKEWFEKRSQIENNSDVTIDKSTTTNPAVMNNKNVEAENPVVPEKRYYCNSCPRSYKLMYNLTLHVRNFHERKNLTEPNNQKNLLEIIPNPGIVEEKYHENYDHSITSSGFEFTAEQINRLEKLFNVKKYINIFEIEQLSKDGQNYPEAKVQKWFEARRLKENPNSEIFVCEFCRQVFKKKHELLYHNDRTHGVTCVFCNRKFTIGKSETFFNLLFASIV